MLHVLAVEMTCQRRRSSPAAPNTRKITGKGTKITGQGIKPQQERGRGAAMAVKKNQLPILGGALTLDGQTDVLNGVDG